MAEQSTPRVTCGYLNSYVGKNVMIVGKVQQLRGDEAVIDADGSFTAHLNRDAHLSAGNGVQIIGKVNPDLSIRVLSSLDLGTGVDFELSNTVAEISHQHRNLFMFE
ncbi:replication factor A protein 3 [Podospora australis]|uniref:Replication factor A protein 3 n=1 Tax=Podospora australis TaxID=1536484 RepID=A0AAN6X6K3_9PEZI|nr:replication factor A protein 3 [Podospora australis]